MSNSNSAQPSSLPSSYFDEVYQAKSDPWDFETSEYERAKYQATIAALPRKSYTSGLEIGCSIGVLTGMLAARCERLLSLDVADVALQQARARCRNLSHVEFRKMSVPHDFPDGCFDLVMMSEVGYYLSLDDLRTAQDLIAAHTVKHAHLVLVHWTPFVPDYPLTGDVVHTSFFEFARQTATFHHLHGSRTEQYRLDVFERV